MDTDNYESVEPNSDDKLRDLSFTDIALRKVPAPILTQLPENASNLNIDSFVPTELTSQNIKLAGETKSLNFSIDNIKSKMYSKNIVSHYSGVIQLSRLFRNFLLTLQRSEVETIEPFLNLKRLIFYRRSQYPSPWLQPHQFHTLYSCWVTGCPNYDLTTQVSDIR